MLGRNSPCWCGSGKKWKNCHFPKLDPIEESAELAKKYFHQYRIVLKTSDEIERIRRACALSATILKEVCALAKAGITTNALNSFAHQLQMEAGARPAPLGFGTPLFPKSICTSLTM